MKSILTLLFCIITVGWVSPIWAQQRPLTKDEMIRRLGGDPDKARAAAAKLALTSPSAEERANLDRVREMSATLTDDIIANIASNDPLLLALYGSRMGTGAGVSNEYPWLLVVDRDIRRRPEAPTLFQTLFGGTTHYGSRAGTMRWLAGNADVPWGDDIMEEAIKLYRADPSKWESNEVAFLCRLVMVRGNESHLAFIDEVDAKGIGSGSAGSAFRYRIQAAKEKKASALAKATADEVSASKPSQSAGLQGKSMATDSNGISWTELVGGVLGVLCIVALLWLALKKRR